MITEALRRTDFWSDVETAESIDVFVSYFSNLEKNKAILENSGWHEHEDVYEHINKVFQRLLFHLDESWLPDEQKSIFSQYFQQSIDGRSRRELLKIATTLHDIAKYRTIQYKPDGKTACPNHEAESAKEAEKYLEALGSTLTTDQKKYILSVVSNHHRPAVTIIERTQQPDLDTAFQQLKDEFPDIYLDLLVLSISDVKGSHLRKVTPQEYTIQVTEHQKKIQAYLQAEKQESEKGLVTNNRL